MIAAAEPPGEPVGAGQAASDGEAEYGANGSDYQASNSNPFHAPGVANTIAGSRYRSTPSAERLANRQCPTRQPNLPSVASSLDSPREVGTFLQAANEPHREHHLDHDEFSNGAASAPKAMK